jgi:hypothetical protein
MNDFLANLVERSLAPTPAVQPRFISLFEPLSADGPAIFPHDDQPQPPAIEKQSEAIPDGASQFESHWRTSPERTVVAETIQAPPTLHAEELRRERLEPPRSIPARSKEADVTGVRAESDTDHKPAAAPNDARPMVPNEKSTGPVVREPEKIQSTELVASTETKTAKPDAHKRRAPRKIFAAHELAVIAFPEKSETAEPRDVRRHEYQDAPNATSIPSVAHEPEKKKTSEVPVNIEPELTEPIARDRRAPGKIFPAREIQLLQPKPAPITRLPSRQPPDIPAPERSIHVTIGRVEVRATLPAPVRSQPPRASAPIMSLDEYLRERAGGSRR